MNVYSLFIISPLNLTTLRFIDWMAIILFGHTPPFEIGETSWALASHLVFAGGLGIIFVYLIPKVKSENLLFKGWLFGIFIWFIFYGISFLYKVEGTYLLPLRTVIANFVGASIYGLTLAETINRLRYKLHSSE